MKNTYEEDEVIQFYDLGYQYEADVEGEPGEIHTVRLCVPCYDLLGLYRVGNRGDSFVGEDAVCNTHYRRKEAGVSDAAMAAPIAKRGRPKGTAKPKEPCSVDECEELSKARGLCNKHYVQAYRAGEVGKDSAGPHLPTTIRCAECGTAPDEYCQTNHPLEAV